MVSPVRQPHGLERTAVLLPGERRNAVRWNADAPLHDGRRPSRAGRPRTRATRLTGAVGVLLRAPHVDTLPWRAVRGVACLHASGRSRGAWSAAVQDREP